MSTGLPSAAPQGQAGLEHLLGFAEVALALGEGRADVQRVAWARSDAWISGIASAARTIARPSVE